MTGVMAGDIFDLNSYPKWRTFDLMISGMGHLTIENSPSALVGIGMQLLPELLGGVSTV